LTSVHFVPSRLHVAVANYA